MALERFSVELTAELKKFLDNVNTARESLNTVSSTAIKVGQQISSALETIRIGKNININPILNALDNLRTFSLKTAGDVSNSIGATQAVIDKLATSRFPTNISDFLKLVVDLSKQIDNTQISATDAGLNKLASTLGNVNNAIVGGAGIISGLRIFRELINSTILGTVSSSAEFVKLSKSLKSAATEFGPLLSRLGPFGELLNTVLQSVTTNTGRLKSLIGVLNQLKQISGVATFAQGLVTQLDNLGVRFQTAIGAITGFRVNASNIPQVINNITNSFKTIPNAISRVITDTNTINQTFTGFFTTLDRLVPGLSSVTGGLSRIGSSLVAVSGPLSSVNSLLGNAAAIMGGTFLAASLAIQASLILVGKAIESLGKKLISFTSDAATASADSQLQFKLLAAEIQNTEEVLGQSQGSLDEWKERLAALSAETGFTQAELARTAARFIQISQEVRLTEQQLFDLVRTTALTGVEVKDLTRSTQGLSGAFIGETESVRQLIGANVLVERINAKVTQSLQRQGLSLTELDENTLRTIQTTEIYNTIQQAAAGNAIALGQSQGNLTVATNRLKGAVQQLNLVVGQDAQSIFASLKNTLADILNTITDTIPGVISFGATLTTVTGFVFAITGAIIKFTAIFGILITAFKGFNLFLSGTIGGFTAFNATVDKTFSAILKTSVQIRSIGDLIRSVFAVVINTVSKLIGSVTNLSSSFSQLGTILNPVRTLILGIFTGAVAEGRIFITTLRSLVTGAISFSAALTTLRATSLGAVASFSLVIARAIVIGQVFSSVIESINRIIKAYAKVSQGQEGFGAAISRSISVAGLFNSVLKILGNTIEFLVSATALGLTTILIGLNSAVQGSIAVFQRFLSILALLPRFLGGGFAEELQQRLQNIDDAVTVAGDNLVETFFVLGEQTQDAGLRLRGLGNLVEGELVPKLVAAGQQIKTNLDPKVTEGIANAFVKLFDAQVEGVTRASDIVKNRLNEQLTLQKQIIDRTIIDETQKANALAAVEQNLVVQTVQLETERLEKTRKLISQRQQFETENLIAILGKEAKNADDRIELQQKIIAKAREAEQKILEDVRSRLQEQLGSIRKQQDERVAIINEARRRIIEIEQGLELDLTNIRLKTLDEDQRQVEVRKEIANRIAEVNRLIGEQSFDLAKQEIERTKGLITQLSSDPTIASAIQQASEIAFAKTSSDVSDIVNVLDRSLTEELPDSVKRAVSNIQDNFRNFNSDIDAVKNNIGDINNVLNRIGEIRGLRQQGDFLKQVADSEIQLNESISSIAQKGLESADRLATQISSRIDSINTQLQQEINKQSTEIEVIAKLNNDSVKTAIDDIKTQAGLTKIEFQADLQPGLLGQLREAVDRLAPIDQRDIEFSLSVSDTEGEERIKTILDDLTEKRDIALQFIPDIDEVTSKVEELERTHVNIPSQVDVPQASVNNRANVPIDQISQEIKNVVGDVNIDAKIQLNIDQTQINQLKNDLQNNPINIPLAVPTVDIPGGSIHPLDEAGRVIEEVITPDSPVSISAAMDNGIFIPGVGTASFPEAGAAIRNTVNPQDPIEVLSQFDGTIFLPGIGHVPIQQAQDSLIQILEPDVPVEVEVEVDANSLNQAKSEIAEGIKNSSAAAREESDRGFFEALIALQQEGQRRSVVIGKLGSDIFKGLTKTAQEELNIIVANFSRGIIDAETALKNLDALESSITAKRKQNLEELQNRPPLFTQNIIEVDRVKVANQALENIRNAPKLISDAIKPNEPISARVQVDTVEAEEQVKRVGRQLGGAIQSGVQSFGKGVNIINNILKGVTKVELNTNIDDVLKQFEVLRNTRISVPVNLKSDKIDIKGGSIHPLTEAAEVFKRILTPENLQVGLESLNTVVPNLGSQIPSLLGQQNNLANQGISRRVQIDLNINGEIFPVQTDEKGADSLERFGRSLKRNTRSSGEFISPFSRNSTN